MAFVFGGNSGKSYEDLQRARQVAEAMTVRSPSPRNVGEGLNAVGRALMARNLGKQADAKRAEMDKEWSGQVAGMKLDPQRAAIFSRLEPGQRDAALLRVLDQRDAEKRAQARAGASAAKAAAKEQRELEARRAIAEALSPQQRPRAGVQVGPTVEAAGAGAASGRDLGALQTETIVPGRQDVLQALITNPNVSMGQINTAMDFIPEAPKQPSSVQEYQFYVNQERSAGREPLSFADFSVMDEKAGVGPTPPELVGTKGQALLYNPEIRDWEMRILPNSELDAERKEALKAEENQEGAKDTAGNVVTTAAQRALAADSERMLTGVMGSIAAYNPSSNNAEVYRQAEVLKSVASAEALNAMRRQSKTGGALGNVTEKELKLLSEQAGALDPRSPNFERDLKDYTRNILRTIHGPAEGDRIFEASMAAGNRIDFGADTAPQDLSEDDADLWKFATPEERQAIWGSQ